MSATAHQSLSLRAGYLLLGGVALTWGGNYPLLKLGLGYAPPLLFTLLRMLLGTMAMFAVARWLGRLRLPPREDLPVVLSVGVVQNMLFITLITFGMQFVPAGRAVVLAYTSSIWVIPLATLLLAERLTVERAIGVALGLAGLALTFSPAAVDWSSPSALIGGGIILLASLAWSLALIHVRRHRWHSDVLDLLPWQLLIGMVALLPVALLCEDPNTIQWDPGFVLLLAISGPVASGLCVAGMVAASRALPAMSMSLMSMAVPAVGVLASVLALGERPSAGDLAGFVAIAAGIGVVSVGDLRRRNAPSPSSASASTSPTSRGSMS